LSIKALLHYNLKIIKHIIIKLKIPETFSFSRKYNCYFFFVSQTTLNNL
jgi:hypothetical protein